MATPQPHQGVPFTDPLFRTIIGTTLGLGTLFGVLIVFWGAGPVLFETPWYIPTMHSFMGLSAFSVAFLALGRYHVLRDPTAYWIGTAYAAFGILSIFFILTWPGLLPSGRGLIAQLPNTSGWIALLELSSLNFFLLAALLGEWPGEQAFTGRRWVWSVGAWLLVITLLASLIVIFEASLPLLVGSQGNLTPLLLGWDWVFMFLFAIGAVLSTRRYLHSGDKLLGYVALTQIVLAYVVLTALIGARRYDLWYYLSRLLLVGGFLTMMFGLLAEYVDLFRRERNKTREVQVRSAELLGILQNSPDAVFVTDEQGSIRYASQKALELLRVGRVAALSHPVADWTSAYEVKDQTGRRLSDEALPLVRVGRGETIEAEEVQFVDPKRGGAIWLLISGSPFTDERGQRIGGILVGTDITERKQAEASLRESEERFRALVKASSQVIYRMSPDWSEMQQLQGGNFIADTEEPNRNWLQVYLHPDDQQRVLAVINEAVRTGSVFELEHRVRRVDGTLGWTASRAVPVRNTAGEIVEWFGAASDITERKQAEVELQQAKEAAEAGQQAAEMANRAKSDFLARMSHEFRTPLNAILGYTQVFKRDRTLTPKQQDGIEIMHQSGEYLLHMITDLMDVSKLEAGKLELQPTPVLLPHFLQVLIDMVRRQAEQKGLTFTHQLDTTVPNAVYIDGKRLREVLLNLLSNAIKYTEAGQVELTVTPINPPEEKEAGIRFQVSDTGIGIDPEALKEIFTPFYQGGDFTSHSEGTGLGLTISRRLVELMGGELQVMSTPDRGSTFWFDLVLPLADVEELVLEGTTPTQTIVGFKGKPAKILLVDDQSENRAMLRDALAPLGFTLIEAANGWEAVQQVGVAAPDLILMDLLMPEMSGFEAIRQIRRKLKLRSIPIIAISASVNSSIYEQSKKVGANAFLTKPIRLDDLFTHLAAHLKLEWRYETPPIQELGPPTQREDIIPPTSEDLRRLRDLARNGFITALDQLLAQLSQTDEIYRPFAEQMNRLADQFEFEKIITLVDQYLERREQ